MSIWIVLLPVMFLGFSAAMACQLRSFKRLLGLQLLHPLMYASPSWWGFTSAGDRERIERLINKLKVFSPCLPPQPPLWPMRLTSDFLELLSTILIMSCTSFSQMSGGSVTIYVLGSMGLNFPLKRYINSTCLTWQHAFFNPAMNF